jgi:hypothetical protein
MKNRYLLSLLAVILLFSSCRKETIGIKTRSEASEHIEEIDFDYFMTKTKVRYSEGDKQVNGNANIRIRKDSLIWFSVSPSIGIEAA